MSGGKKLWKITITVFQTTITGYMFMISKQNNNMPCGSSKTSQIQRKLFVEETLRSKCCRSSFFGTTGHVALEQRRMVDSKWYTIICLPEVLGKIR